MQIKNKAVFLDRDGVINVEVNYLSDPKDLKLIEGTIEALKILKKKGYLLIIVTNQSAIARGYFDERTLKKIHSKLKEILKKNHIEIDEIYYCPHHPDFTGECDCRKPKPGMIFKARDEFNIDLQQSYMVGDTLKDIEAGKNAGCKTVLVLTGYGIEEKNKIKKIKPDFIFKNLLEFAKNLK
ncbi:MAG: D-glycero-beta-D-manno-heptose 1,7-bisphosphate 7-phosphatase [Promethearchaeota archaeon]